MASAGFRNPRGSASDGRGRLGAHRGGASAIRRYLHNAGEDRWSAPVLPLVVAGSVLFAVLPGIELAPMAAADAGADPAAARFPDGSVSVTRRRRPERDCRSVRAPMGHWPRSRLSGRFASGSLADLQPVVSDFAKVMPGTAGFAAGHATQAPVDGLAFEAGAGFSYFGDDLSSSELGCTGTLLQSVDGGQDGVSAAGTAVDERSPVRRDSDRRSVHGVGAVRIVYSLWAWVYTMRPVLAFCSIAVRGCMLERAAG
ncbi:hypothetical protein BH23ACT10_BH23ACT10_36840 [soil metagenome]